jgi:Flp pilus assembly protein TadG
MFGRRTQLWRDEDGSALLEGAIVVPFLFTLVLGTLEFSHFFFQQHLVSTGVRDAARYLARVVDSSASASQTAAQNLAANGALSGGTARVAGFVPANVTIVFTYVDNTPGGSPPARPYREAYEFCTDPTAVDPRNTLRMINVTGTFAYTSLGFRVGLPAITVTHTERCIGPS